MVAAYLVDWNPCPLKLSHLPVEEMTDGCVFPVAIVNVSGDDNEIYRPADRLVDQFFECLMAGSSDTRASSSAFEYNPKNGLPRCKSAACRKEKSIDFHHNTRSAYT
jgi:hypothetical protein